jgi:DNA repair ATPase RecN
MAQRVDEAKYEAMIAALQTFASNVSTAASEMQSLASVCVQALSEEDQAVGEIYNKIRDCQLKYAEATNQAKSIAAAMQEELAEMKAEEQIWSSDDSIDE